MHLSWWPALAEIIAQSLHWKRNVNLANDREAWPCMKLRFAAPHLSGWPPQSDGQAWERAVWMMPGFVFVLVWPLPFSGAHESLSISCVVYLLFANSRKMVYMSWVCIFGLLFHIPFHSFHCSICCSGRWTKPCHGKTDKILYGAVYHGSSWIRELVFGSFSLQIVHKLC